MADTPPTAAQLRPFNAEYQVELKRLGVSGGAADAISHAARAHGVLPAQLVHLHLHPRIMAEVKPEHNTISKQVIDALADPKKAALFVAGNMRGIPNLPEFEGRQFGQVGLEEVAAGLERVARARAQVDAPTPVHQDRQQPVGSGHGLDNVISKPEDRSNSNSLSK